MRYITYMEYKLNQPRIGDQLKQKREQIKLSIDEVASRLCLKKELVDAIENDNYEHIPLTYLKGYIRSYAKLLSITDADSLQALEYTAETNPMSGWMFFSTHKQMSSGD